MTLVHASANHDDGNPKTHALIIGVGKYTHLPGGNGPLNTNVPLGLGQLSSPPISAQAFADWLIKTPLNNPVAPLGTVELLLSPSQNYVQVNGQAIQVEAATLGNIQLKFDDWFSRCHTHAGNVAMFYFCGHGLEKDTLTLLPEDFGASLANPWRHAIDFWQTYRGMASCLAKTQCYFIDSCRQVTTEALQATAFGGISLASANQRIPHIRTAPILFATAEGSAAFGDANAVSRFTTALLEALKGGGAKKQSGGRWVIDTDYLGSAVRDIITWQNRDLSRDKQQNVDPKPSGPYQVIHQLPGPPSVSTLVGCLPEVAVGHAEFYLVGRQRTYQRQPMPGLWSQQVEAGTYDVRVLFPQGNFINTEVFEEFVTPPIYSVNLEVQ